MRRNFAEKGTEEKAFSKGGHTFHIIMWNGAMHRAGVVVYCIVFEFYGAGKHRKLWRTFLLKAKINLGILSARGLSVDRWVGTKGGFCCIVPPESSPIAHSGRSCHSPAAIRYIFWIVFEWFVNNGQSYCYHFRHETKCNFLLFALLTFQLFVSKFLEFSNRPSAHKFSCTCK